MASDFLLEIDGIKGESSDSKHKETIEIESFSWGVSNPGSFASGGGGGAGKASFSDITIMMRAGKSSPEIFKACATGKHIKKATLFVRKSGGDQSDYYVIKLEDVLVSSYQSSAANGANALPMETLSLNYAKIEFNYSPQKPDGKLDSPVIAKYNLKENIG
jgi:type VI secretion system secreted protein Hcp